MNSKITDVLGFDVGRGKCLVSTLLQIQQLHVFKILRPKIFSKVRTLGFDDMYLGRD